MEIPKKLEKFEKYLRSTEKPAVEITFKRGATLPWESKCGGCPYLESVDDYPRDKYDAPMMFLAQINLDEMPHLEGFPTHGLLQFYIGDDDCLSFDSPCKVVYLPEYKKDADTIVKENPFEKSYVGHTPFSHEGKMSFTKTTRFIGYGCGAFHESFDEVATEEDLDALYELCYPQGCLVGGYPLFIQNPLSNYDDGEVDVVLLQLDCEDECGIMFGDAGNCVFLISTEDLKNKEFGNVVYDWQCY